MRTTTAATSLPDRVVDQIRAAARAAAAVAPALTDRQVAALRTALYPDRLTVVAPAAKRDAA